VKTGWSMDLPEFLATSNIARYAVDARLPQHISIQNRVTLLLPVDFQFGTNTLLHQKPLNKPLLEKACNTLAPIIHKLIVKHPCPGTSSAFFVKAIRNVRSPSLVLPSPVYFQKGFLAIHNFVEDHKYISISKESQKYFHLKRNCASTWARPAVQSIDMVELCEFAEVRLLGEKIWSIVVSCKYDHIGTIQNSFSNWDKPSVEVIQLGNTFLVMVSNTSQVALVYSYLFKKVGETTTAAASTELLMILLTYDFEKLLKIYIAIGMSLLYHIKYGIWNSIYYDYSLRRGEYAFQPKETYVTEASYTVG